MSLLPKCGAADDGFAWKIAHCVVEGHCEKNGRTHVVVISAAKKSQRDSDSQILERGNEMKNNFRGALLGAAVVGVSLLAGCGGVSGNTYVGANGGYTIEFQSGGKAIESLGPQKDNCTYVEDSGKSVTLTCADGKTTFTFDAKGNLVPPSGSMLGMMGPLTKK